MVPIDILACDWQDQAIAVGAGLGLTDKGLTQLSEAVSTEVKLGAQGQSALSEGLLEARLWDWYQSASEPSMANLQQSFARHEAGPGIGLLKKLGVTMTGGSFTCADEVKVSEVISARQDFLAKLPQIVSDLDDDMLSHFKSRRNFIEFVDTTRTWTLTPEGSSIDSNLLVETTMVNEITPELLQSDAWKDAEFRRFDVTLESATPRTGRSHPMQSLIERIRHIFLEMGFSEIVEDYVKQQAGIWMPCLYLKTTLQEMQDTFILTILNRWICQKISPISGQKFTGQEAIQAQLVGAETFHLKLRKRVVAYTYYS